MNATILAKVSDEKSLAGMAGTFLALIGVAFLLKALAISDPPAGALSALAGAVPAAIAYRLAKRRRVPAQEIEALAHGRFDRPIALVIAFLSLALLALDSLVGATVGFLVGLGATDEEIMFQAIGVGLLYIGIPLELIAAFFVAKRAARYLGKKPLGWIALSVAGFVVMRGIIIVVFMSGGGAILGLQLAEAVVGLFVFGALMLIVCWIGAIAARRRQLEFVAGRLFRELSAGDQEAALGILGQAVRPTIRG